MDLEDRNKNENLYVKTSVGAYYFESEEVKFCISIDAGPR